MKIKKSYSTTRKTINPIKNKRENLGFKIKNYPKVLKRNFYFK